MPVRKDDDLGPDGVRIIVDWDAMGVGDSVLVPCINVNLARRQATKIFRDKGWKPRFQIQKNSQVLGLRIWRIT